MTASELTVGQVAQRSGVSVRTLHHYDAIALLVPSGRTAAGYRLYTEPDVARLAQIVVYRRLGFPLDTIAALLDDPAADVVTHLRRQREAVMTRLDEMHGLVAALDRALEAEMSGTDLTPQEQRELFGEHYDESWATEAEERWGDTDAWTQSQARTSRYTKVDWEQVKAEQDALNAELVAAKRSGEPPTGERAMDAAEAHRLFMSRRFYDVPHGMHRALGDMYVADERFTRHYDEQEPGLAQYVRDAIDANADRHEG